MKTTRREMARLTAAGWVGTPGVGLGATGGGRYLGYSGDVLEPVRKQVRLWVCMGARFPAKDRVRRAYQWSNFGKAQKSWDQTAVLYGVRCLEQDKGLWTLSAPGMGVIGEKGATTWREDGAGRHEYLPERMAPGQVAGVIDELMMARG